MANVSSQTPSGWYPDSERRMRFWDGVAWTDQAEPPPPPSGGPSPDPATVGPPPPKTDGGAFGKLKRAASDRQAAKADQSRKQAEYARDAGVLITSGIFGTSTVEIYSGGYVRVASGERPSMLGKSQPGRAMSPGQPVAIRKSTPYEVLRSIKFTPPANEKSSGPSSPSEDVMGPAMAKLMRGGKAALKGSVPGLAATGIAYMASTESRTSYLTIATDREIHQLTNQGHNGFVKTTNKGHADVGLALESAGNAVLGVSPAPPTGMSTGASPVGAAVAPQSPPVEDPSPSQTMGSRLRELAELHKEGILSDEEFSTAKAKLLDGL